MLLSEFLSYKLFLIYCPAFKVKAMVCKSHHCQLDICLEELIGKLSKMERKKSFMQLTTITKRRGMFCVIFMHFNHNMYCVACILVYAVVMLNLLVGIGQMTSF